MDKTSKRDIYDLIAELAKSTNMNLDGTEFVPEPVDVRRKSIAPDEEKTVAKNYDELIHLEPAPKEQSTTTESDMLHEIQLAKLASMEELNRMKAAALEELKQARAALVNEFNGQVTQTKEPSFVNGTSKNGSANSYESITTSVAQQMPPQQIHLVEENNKPSLSQTQTLLEVPTAEETDFFETVSVDELNRITSEAVKEGTEVVADKVATVEPNSVIQALPIEQELIREQLKSISEKIDQLSPKNLKTEIVNELKLSDERIVQSVNKSKEHLLDELSNRFQLKPVSNQSVMKWLGLFNLMLLLLVLAYLLFQKNSPIGSIQKAEQLTQPESQPNHQDKATQPASTELTNSNELNENENPVAVPIEESKSSVTSTFQTVESTTTVPKSAELVVKPLAAHTSTSSIKNNSNPTVNKMTSTTSVKNNLVDSKSNEGLIKAIQKNESESKPSVEVSKKSTPKQDVYFGED